MRSARTPIIRLLVLFLIAGLVSWTHSLAASQQAKLVATNPIAEDNLGEEVAVSENTVLVGVPYRDTSPLNGNGAVIVFVRNGTTWTQQAELIASDRISLAYFGKAVAIQGDTAVIGAPFDGASSSFKGAAYVFTRSGTTWTQRAKLTASDYANSAAFGKSVAIDGNTIVIGSSTDGKGAAYVFVGSGATWAQQAKIQGADALAGDGFSNSVSLSSDTVVIGSPLDDVNNSSANDDNGSAYVFTRSGTTWTLQIKLVAADTDLREKFGNSVSLKSNTVLIGTPGESTTPTTNNGAAYVFTRSGTTWTQQTKLLVTDPENEDSFGFSLALDGSGTVAIIGAYQKSTANAAFGGVAYIFTNPGTGWVQLTKISGNDTAFSDYFGYAVGMDYNFGVIGAPYVDITPNGNEGAAYIFIPVPTPQPDTIGVYKNGVFYLRNQNNTGSANQVVNYGGDATDLPVVGDWNGDGMDTIGVYRGSNGLFFLSDSNSSPTLSYNFVLGNPGDTPFVGRWRADMTHDGVGVYRPSNGILYQKRDLTSGFSDYFAVMGNPGDTGFAGDWDGNGLDSVGVYRPTGTHWYMTNQSEPSGITFSDVDFVWDISTDQPIVGDWDANTTTEPGRFNATTGTFTIRNALSGSGTDTAFSFGPTGGKAVTGKWTLPSLPPILVNAGTSYNTSVDTSGGVD